MNSDCKYERLNSTYFGIGDSGGPLQLPFTVEGMNEHVYYQIGVVR